MLNSSIGSICEVREVADITLSQYQEAILDHMDNYYDNLVIEAYAGSGKTFILLEIINMLREEYDIMALAFNKSIQLELDQKVNHDSRQSEVSVKTTYAVGLSLLRRLQPVKIENLKYRHIIREMMEPMRHLPFEDRVSNERNMVKLANLVRLNGLDIENTGEHIRLAIRHAFNMDDWAFDLLKRALCKGIEIFEQQQIIDFADMIFLPNRYDLQPHQRYDILLVDELQDLNLSQLDVALRFLASDGQFVGVGDDKQSIYGFAGAHAGMIGHITQKLNASRLSLPITYRCASRIVRLAQRYVPDLQARPNAPGGHYMHVGEQYFPDIVQPGDLVLSRLCAPLISTCMALMKAGKPAKIRRASMVDILRDGFRDIERLNPGFRYTMIPEYLDAYQDHLTQKATKKGVIDYDAEQIIEEKVSIMRACYDNMPATDLEGLYAVIEKTFNSEDGNAISLMTVHTAKGLEAERVFIIDPDSLPLTGRPNMTSWQMEQERNLAYVAYTRAIDTLCEVCPGGPELKEIDVPLLKSASSVSQAKLLPVTANLQEQPPVDEDESSEIITGVDWNADPSTVLLQLHTRRGDIQRLHGFLASERFWKKAMKAANEHINEWEKKTNAIERL
jgi:DNA helicase-2/ATP-dependent DNA helicase PcrA